MQCCPQRQVSYCPDLFPSPLLLSSIPKCNESQCEHFHPSNRVLSGCGKMAISDQVATAGKWLCKERLEHLRKQILLLGVGGQAFCLTIWDQVTEEEPDRCGESKV